MPDTPLYNATDVAGTSYQRCSGVRINNPLDAVPSIVLEEEKIINLGDGETIHKNCAGLFTTFNPENPKHLAAYNAINEIYIELRELRDNPPVEPPLEP